MKTVEMLEEGCAALLLQVLHKVRYVKYLQNMFSSGEAAQVHASCSLQS